MGLSDKKNPWKKIRKMSSEECSENGWLNMVKCAVSQQESFPFSKQFNVVL